MDQQSQNIDKLFRDVLNQQTIMPSSGVLKGIRFKLWMSDFFSANPRKFNIVYTTVIVGSAISLFIASSKVDILQWNSGLNNNDLGRGKVEKEFGFSTSDDKSIASTSESATYQEDVEFSASFDIDEAEGCSPFTVHFKNKSSQAVSYEWDFDNGSKSSERNPVCIYDEPGNYKITLTIKNKDGETNVFSKNIKVKQSPQARFVIDIENSDVDEKNIAFKNLSTGSKIYSWDFGDNAQSEDKDAVHNYSDYGSYKVELIAKSQNGCTDTAKLINKFIEKDFELAFPLNFRPNLANQANNGYYASNGSKGSVFYPKNNGADNYELKIFAPNGLEVFTTTDIQQGWNGYIKGRLAPPGSYTYKTKGVYPSGRPFELRGSFRVIIEDYD